MPKMLPYPVTQFTTPTEKLIYESLNKHLGEDYTIIYGQNWKLRERGKREDYERDFIIVKKGGGIIVLEVKGGQWERRNGCLYANGELVDSKDDPFKQARENKHSLLQLLKKEIKWKNTYFPIGDLVALPEAKIHIAHDGLTTDEVLTASELPYIQEWIESAMHTVVQASYPTKCNDPMIQHIIQTLLRDYTVKLNEILSTDEERLLILTQQQLELDRHFVNQKRLTIQGCAGSGKTLMAIKQVKRLAKKGDVKNILFLCYNLELGEWLQKQTNEISKICTTAPFLSYCEDQAKAFGAISGQEVHDNSFYKSLPYKLLDVIDQITPKYDAIVVDEGQMFDTEWWEIIKYLMNDCERSYYYIFYDDLQRIYREEQNQIPGEDQSIPLLVNLRNTEKIHHLSTMFLPADKLPDCNNIPGEPIWISTYQDETSMKKLLRRYLAKIIQDGGVSSKDIVVLSAKGSNNTCLTNSEKLGPYQLSNSENPNPASIRFSTVLKYRGMERKVVILTELDETVTEFKKYIYIGASRARTKLIVLASEKIDPALEEKIAQKCDLFLGAEK